MTLQHSLRLLLIVALASAAACTGTPTRRGMPWWPQGPGNPPETEQTSAITAKDEQPSTSAQPATARTSSIQAQPVAAAAQVHREPESQSMGEARALPAPAVGNDAHATRYGDLLFLSGQIATDAQNRLAVGSTIDQQTHAVMKKIGAILDSHRLTMANIVQVTVYLANIDDLNGMDTAYASHFRSSLPARSVVEVARLPRGALVEISVIAGR